MASNGGWCTAVLTTKQINELALEWQRELRLQDWEIDVRIVRAKSGELAESELATCEYEQKRLEASIILRHGRDAHPKTEVMRPYDMEVALVHEFLHIVFWAWSGKKTGDLKDVSQEQAIHRQSLLLVRMRRQLMPEKYAALGLPQLTVVYPILKSHDE